VVSSFTAGATGTVTGAAGHSRLWMSSGTGSAEMVIYSDSAGAPNTLLGTSGTVVVSNTAEAQVDFTFSTPVSITNGVTYWIGFTWADPGANSFTWSRDAKANLATQNSLHGASSFGSGTLLSGAIDAYVDITVSTPTHTCTLFTKTATGSDTLTVTTSGSTASTHAALAVKDWSAVEAVSADGTSATTVAVANITPAAGAGDYLCVEVISTDSSSTTTESLTASTDFVNTQTQNPSGNSSAATFTAEKSYISAATLTPGNATLGAAEQWIAFTVAFTGTVTVTPTEQTFTVDPLPVARSAGAAVAVWDPPVLGL